MTPDRGYRKANLPENAKRVFEGEIFDVYQWEQELYDGSKTTFERLVRPDTASIFPVFPDGRILITEDTQPEREPILTVPTGRIEEGETPEQTAKRELLEETGYTVETIEPFYEERPYSKIDWVVYVFIGRGAKKVQESKLDSGEKIIPRLVSFDELVGLAAGGKMYRDDFTRVVLQAKLDSRKMEELKKKFLG